MTFNTLVVILLFATLSGCYPLPASVVIEAAAPVAVGAAYSMAEEEGRNYYEPVVLWSNEEAISIKYLTVNSNAMHGEVNRLIEENCEGSYVETSRQEIEGWTTVDAECT
jgi:hypothetical protein